MARLNMASSRVRPAICSLVRIDQTCFGRRGGLAPISLPLFQGSRREPWGVASVGLRANMFVYADYPAMGRRVAVVGHSPTAADAPQTQSGNRSQMLI